MRYNKTYVQNKNCFIPCKLGLDGNSIYLSSCYGVHRQEICLLSPGGPPQIPGNMITIDISVYALLCMLFREENGCSIVVAVLFTFWLIMFMHYDDYEGFSLMFAVTLILVLVIT